MKNGKNWLFVALMLPFAVMAQESLQKMYPVNFAKVRVTDPFWKGRMQVVATSTLDACVLYTETKTGRIRNFEKAAAGSGKHEGIYYDDSDVYKAIEAMAYSLKTHPNQTIEKKADEWIAKIAAAQMPDGYLNTYYQLMEPDKRWTDMERHEDYCAGHLIEAGIAYYNTTGKPLLLDVGIRFANHIDSMFRVPNKPWVSGHQEIELALMRLYHHTGQRKYLELSQWFLEQRGKGYGKGKIWDEWKDPDYCQDGLPVKEQREITGHAVRAMYMYAGAADVAAVTHDEGYMNAMHHIWEDVVHRNMYITGGIGAQGTNEGFGKDYDLPNQTAYCETCASVGMVFWNQRMNMLSGESKYIDVLERSLYNAALDGLSQSGDRFFYGNPLASSGEHQRREWFGTACCPSNIARLVSSLGNYVYNTSPGAVWVNLYIGSEVNLQLGKQKVGLSMQTGYPWKGNTTIAITETGKAAYQLRLRIPGWLTTPVPGDLYRFSDGFGSSRMSITVNGKPVEYQEENGYAVIDRKWKKGDVVELITPFEVRRVVSNPQLKQNEGRVALQYGPLVYCVEGADNDEKAMNFIVPDGTKFDVAYETGILGGVNTIRFEANSFAVSADKLTVRTERKTITAVPYFSWNNRGVGEMQVWLPVTIGDLKISP